jgi:hypothetical protein
MGLKMYLPEDVTIKISEDKPAKIEPIVVTKKNSVNEIAITRKEEIKEEKTEVIKPKN